MFARFLFSLSLLFAFTTSLFAEILSKEGDGYLEKIEGQLVLHVKGTPYERGYQHGKLLSDMIRSNISTFTDKSQTPRPGFLENVPKMLSHVPKHFHEEMKGLSDGSGIPLQKIVLMNLFPEMFHCSGITVAKEASQNGKLYHVRVLDYAIGKNLQNTAVLMIASPVDGNSYLNVSYAGFIGTVTGMNDQKIALGEIGGKGYGNWDGMPMAFLLREVLEQASTLAEAKEILKNTPRTCEYYYVLSDGKTLESCGVYATESQIHFIEPGTPYALLSPKSCPKNYALHGENDKFFLGDHHFSSSSHQMVLYDGNTVSGIFHLQPKDTVLMTGYPSERYPYLAERVMQHYGTITPDILIEIIKQPVARESNLHNAIFSPSDLKVWVSHAGPNSEPACDQPYHAYCLTELLGQ